MFVKQLLMNKSTPTRGILRIHRISVTHIFFLFFNRFTVLMYGMPLSSSQSFFFLLISQASNICLTVSSTFLHSLEIPVSSSFISIS